MYICHAKSCSFDGFVQVQITKNKMGPYPLEICNFHTPQSFCSNMCLLQGRNGNHVTNHSLRPPQDIIRLGVKIHGKLTSMTYIISPNLAGKDG